MITRKKIKQLWTRLLIRIGYLPTHIAHREEKEIRPRRHISSNVTVYCTPEKEKQVLNLVQSYNVIGDQITVQGCMDFMDTGMTVQIDFQDIRRQMFWYSALSPIRCEVQVQEVFSDPVPFHSVRVEEIDYDG